MDKQRKNSSSERDAPGKGSHSSPKHGAKPSAQCQSMLVELVEEGLEAKKQKEKAFFELAERFRAADDLKEVQRLGEELGQMVFRR